MAADCQELKTIPQCIMQPFTTRASEQ